MGWRIYPKVNQTKWGGISGRLVLIQRHIFDSINCVGSIFRIMFYDYPKGSDEEIKVDAGPVEDDEGIISQWVKPNEVASYFPKKGQTLNEKEPLNKEDLK